MRGFLLSIAGAALLAMTGSAQAWHHQQGHHHGHHHGHHGFSNTRLVHPGHPAVVERRVAVPVYVERRVAVPVPVFVDRPVAVPVDRPVPVFVERRVAVPVAVPVPVYVRPRLVQWEEQVVTAHPAPIYYGHQVVTERRCWVQNQPVFNSFGDMQGVQAQRICR